MTPGEDSYDENEREVARRTNAAGSLPGEAHFAEALRDMPRIDRNALPAEPGKSFLLCFSAGHARYAVGRRPRNRIESPVSEACSSYWRLPEGWIKKNIAEIRKDFDAQADGYRARLGRLPTASAATPEMRAGIARELAERGESGAVEAHETT